jgi:peptidoglycan/xylan/chitin deacetylase (PgdA/CDA1 family)
MPLRPFHLWLASVCFFAVAFAVLPGERALLSLGMAAHVPVLLWGVFDMRAQFFCATLLRAPGRSREVALTFDDGPDPNITPDILDLLGEQGVTATFFVVGRKAQRHPEITKRAFEEGHTVGCHDLSHSLFSNFRMTGRMVREIGNANDIIAAIIRKRPALYRPPVGLTNPHLAGALHRLGMVCVGWSRRAGDAGNRRRRALRKIPALASAGEVVMIHDTLPAPELKQAVLDAVDRLCVEMKRRGLEPVGIDRLFSVPAYGNG